MKRILLGCVAGLAGAAALALWLWSGPEEQAKLDCDTAKPDIEAILAAAMPGHKALLGAIECGEGRLTVAELRLLPQEAALDTPGITLRGLVLEAVDVPAIKAVLMPDPEADPVPPEQAQRLLSPHVTVAEAIVRGGGSDISLANLVISGLEGRSAAPGAGAPRFGLLSFETANADRIDVGHGEETPEKTSYHAAAFAGFDGTRFGSVELSGWASADPGGMSRISCSNVFYRGIDAASLWIAFGYVPKELQALPKGFGADPAAGMSTVAKAMMEMNQEISIDASGARNCAFVMNAPEVTINGKIGAWLVEGQRGLSIARASYDDLSATAALGEGKDVTVAVARLAIAGMNAGEMFRAMAEGTKLVPDLSRFRLEQFEMSKLSVTVTGRPPVTLERLAVISSDYIDDIAAKGTAALAGLVFPAGILEGEAREVFDLLGYGEIRLDASLAYTYDHQGKILDMKQIEIVQPDGARLSLAFRFKDYDIKEIYDAMSSMRPPIALAGAKLDALSLVYEDQSLFGRVLNLLAAERGMPVEDLVDEAREELANESLEAPGPITKAALLEVARFLEDPRRLALAIAPTRMATFAEIGGRIEDVEGLAKLLGLTVKAN